MRIGFFFASLSVTLFVVGVAGAQTETAPAGAAATQPEQPAVSPPPAAYPPPPPVYDATPAPPERTANNSIYIEGLGPGILYSINYDRNFGDFAGRVGFGYISLSASSRSSGGSSEAHASVITVPLTITYLGIGSKKNIFEIGGGVTILHAGAGVSSFAVDDSKTASSSATVFLGNMVFGYRLQPPDGGFLLRTGISPIFGGGVVIPLPYLALGGTF